MRVELRDVTISVDGRRESVDSEMLAAGAHVVVVTTVLEERSIELVSNYVASLDGHAAAVHMWSTSRGPRFAHRPVDLAGTRLARGCLLDHAAELRELLAEELDDLAVVQIDIGDGALDRASGVWDSGERP